MWSRRRPAPTRPAASLLAGLSLFAACERPAAQPASDVAAWEEEVRAWSEDRVERLRSEEGWLSLAGLSWLEEGANSVGSDPEARVVLPQDKAPEHLGTIHLEDGRVRIEVEAAAGVAHDGEPVETLDLLTDADEDGPTRLELGDLVFYAIRRGDRYGVRIKDRQHPARLGFEGIESFPLDPAWRIEARFDEYDPPKQIPIANVVGQVSDNASWGAVVFDRDDETWRLDVLAEPGADELFILFADGTTGEETYGAGRYLYAEAPDARGRVILDFNRAYNPPCVFTPYATCPLPPRQNRLALRVEAGEKMWGGGH